MSQKLPLIYFCVISLLGLVIQHASAFLNCGNCSRGDTLICPDLLNYQFQINIRENSDGTVVYMLLTCSDISNVDFSLVKDCLFPTVNYLKIKFCPLSNDSLAKTMEMIGVRPENIEHLSIYHPIGGVSVLRSDFFDRFSNLIYLDLDSTKLEDIHEEVFVSTPSLKRLYIKGNRLNSLKGNIFQSLPELKLLNLNHNSMTYISDGLLNNLRNLETLHIWSNNITTLPSKVFHHLQKLQNLTLMSNKLTYLEGDLFINNHMLSNINFKRNNLKLLPEDLFVNNTQLISARFSDNAIELIPDNFFKSTVNITLVEFKGNKLSTIPNSLFKFCTYLSYLSLSKNNISVLPADLFSMNKKLTSIYVSHNSIQNIVPGLFDSSRNLKNIFLNDNKLHNLPRSLFENCLSLEQLKLNNNSISVLSHNVFPVREKSSLKIIDLSHNLLDIKGLKPHHIFALNAQLKLRNIDFSYNKFTSFPFEFYFFNFFSLEKLNFEGNKMKQLILSDLPNEVVVNLKFNEIARIRTPLKDEKKTLNVFLEGNNFTCDCLLYDFVSIIQNDAAKLSRFSYSIATQKDNQGSSKESKHADIVHVFDKDKLLCHRPYPLINQSIIDVPVSMLTCELREQDCSPNCPCIYFPHDTRVRVDCTGLEMETLPEVFMNPNYNYEYIMDQNQLSFFNFSLNDPIVSLSFANNNLTYENLNNDIVLPLRLQYLNLTYNLLTHLSEIFLNQFESREIEIDISSNPWICDCSIKHLHNFVQAEFAKVRNIRDVICADYDGLPLIDLTEEDVCPLLLQPVVLTSIGVVTLLLVISAVIGTVLFFRYNTRIKIWLYSQKLCLWLVTADELDSDKQYDAFISYSHKDEEFVNTVLVPGLENGDPQYRVCLHYRDWVAGEYIQTQIMNSVQKSRRTLVVLSNNFIESVWGQMEFRAAHQQALKDKTNRVIVIVYGEMPPDSAIDEELRHYVALHTYLKWGDARFWETLRYSMPHPRRLNKNRKRRDTDKMELVNGSIKESNGAITV